MHPCCGRSLQTGTKIIAIVNMVFSIIIIVFGVFAILGGAALASDEVSQKIIDLAEANGTILEKRGVESVGVAVLITSIVVTVWCIVSLFGAILLLVGADTRNRNLCMVWLILVAIGLVIAIIKLLLGWSQDPAYLTTGIFVGILIEFYFMWVVWAFMSELKEGPRRIVTPYTNSKA